MKKILITGGAIAVLCTIFWFLLPDPLFDDPLSTVIYDRNGELMGARIAGDQQWRFPPPDSLPRKYEQALLLYEDRYFYLHPGINPGSMVRAMVQNIRQGEVVSGGSTITMQLIRMSRKDRPRTVTQKFIESLLALRLELTSTKEEILQEYAARAPFGGNVVGLEAASWRYFATDPFNLSWAESAMLAILPNAPSLIHPGRNRELLREKRDRLLQRLLENGSIDSMTLHLARMELIPEDPYPLPDLASHVTERFMADRPGIKYVTSLDASLQRRAVELAEIHAGRLERNQIHNLAGLVMEVETGRVLIYLGNISGSAIGSHGHYVDVIRSPRSTGSILKPILFAAMMDEGFILPGSLVPDVPVRYDGYAPKNYNRGYEGAVEARQALGRSLNVPSVIMLRRFGVDPFLDLLGNLGFTTFRDSPEHYGLTLILGGGEATLWELTGVYGSLARVLKHQAASGGDYFTADMRMPLLQLSDTHDPCVAGDPLKGGVISAASLFLTFEALLEVNRPDEFSAWHFLRSSYPIAWKTGTSYGFRDAWSIGVTPEYVVAVWAGNADGEGRPGLTGLNCAAPLMFDLFGLLPPTVWFDGPAGELVNAVVCRKSGYLAGMHCPERDSVLIAPGGLNVQACPYHRPVHLSSDGRHRVSSRCYPVSRIRTETWFLLPPLMEVHYRRKDPSYRLLPGWMEGCERSGNPDMEIVYPAHASMVTIPRELDGTDGRMVMEVAHRDPAAVVYWHVDDRYLASTGMDHRMEVFLHPGDHRLTVVDDRGESHTVKFLVLAGVNE